MQASCDQLDTTISHHACPILSNLLLCLAFGWQNDQPPLHYRWSSVQCVAPVSGTEECRSRENAQITSNSRPRAALLTSRASLVSIHPVFFFTRHDCEVISAHHTSVMVSKVAWRRAAPLEQKLTDAASISWPRGPRWGSR